MQAAAVPPPTPFEQRIATLAASIDFSKVDSGKWRDIWTSVASELGLADDDARAIGASDTSTAESRLTSIGVIKASPTLFLVFSRLDGEELLRRVRTLIPVTRHLRTVVVFEEIPDWRAVRILDVRPHGVGAAAQAHFPAAEVERLDEQGRPIASTTTQLPPSWIVLHSSAGDYENIDGVRYRYPKSIPNGSQIDAGHVVVCYRTVNSGTGDAGCIFGIGRIGRRRTRSGEQPEKREVYYDRFLPVEPIKLAELGDPRDNKTNAIVHAPSDWVADLLERLKIESVEGLPVPPHALALDDVLDELDKRQLFVPRSTAMKVVSAIRAGKHLMLTGPPGTGKTTFGEAIAAAASKVGLCSGWILTTATADWTSTDTVGAYRMNRQGDLEFQAGQILEAIDSDRWLVIDGLNRADMDKAVGQIFTVLSGQAVVTPFLETRDGQDLPAAIVPYGASVPEHTHVHPLERGWRLIATMNERDRDLLFDLSEALLRRFAIIEIGPPSAELWLALLDAKGRTGDAKLDQAGTALTTVKTKPLGPAVVLDLVAHLREQLLLHDELEQDLDRRAIFDEALSLYVRPHLRDLAPQGAAEAETELRKIRDGLAVASAPAESDPAAGTGQVDAEPPPASSEGQSDGG